jgi:hypothetical protein
MVHAWNIPRTSISRLELLIAINLHMFAVFLSLLSSHSGRGSVHLMRFRNEDARIGKERRLIAERYVASK